MSLQATSGSRFQPPLEDEAEQLRGLRLSETGGRTERRLVLPKDPNEAARGSLRCDGERWLAW